MAASVHHYRCCAVCAPQPYDLVAPLDCRKCVRSADRYSSLPHTLHPPPLHKCCCSFLPSCRVVSVCWYYRCSNRLRTAACTSAAGPSSLPSTLSNSTYLKLLHALFLCRRTTQSQRHHLQFGVPPLMLPSVVDAARCDSSTVLRCSYQIVCSASEKRTIESYSSYAVEQHHHHARHRRCLRSGSRLFSVFGFFPSMSAQRRRSFESTPCYLSQRMAADCEVWQLLERWRDLELDESGPEINSRVESIYAVLHERKYRTIQKLTRMCRTQLVQLFASFDMLGADFDSFEDMVFRTNSSMRHFNIRPSVSVELPGVSIDDHIKKRKRGGSMTAGQLRQESWRNGGWMWLTGQDITCLRTFMRERTFEPGKTRPQN